MAVLFTIINTTICQAQTENKVLDSVLIKAERNRFSLTSTTPVQTLSGKKLAQLNSFSVADALRYFSGVQLKDYGGIGGIKTINVRNMGTQHVAVMLDGIRIINAQNGTVDLSKYSLDNIDLVQLYNGGNLDGLQPALNLFSSSAIYLQSKRPVFDSLQKSRKKINIKTGSFGLFNSSFTWQQKLNSTTDLSSNIEFITANGKYKYRYTNGYYDTTAIRHNGDITGIRIENYLIKKIKNTDELFLKTYYYGSNRGLPGAIVANKYYSPQRLNDKNFYVQGSYKNNHHKNYALNINTKISTDYTRYIDPDFITTSGILNNIYKQKEFYISVAQSFSIKNWWQIALATDFSAQDMRANLYRFPYPTRLSYTAAFTNSFNWDQLSITSGVLGAYFDEKVKQYQATKNEQALVPTISVSWQPYHHIPLRIKSFYKASMRLPSFNDLYYTQVGNIQLKPEYAKQWNLGFTWIQNLNNNFKISVQNDIYYNQITNKIVAVPAANLFRWMMINLGKVDIKGLEINTEITKNFFKNIELNAGVSYTYQEAKNKTIGQSSYNHQIPYTPYHSGTFYSSINWNNWFVNYSFLYTGARYVLPENIPVNYMQPSYASDIGIQKNIRAENNIINLGFEINNIFNQYYDVVLNFPMPGINYKFSLSINF